MPSDDDESDIAIAAYVTVNSVSLLNAKDQDIVNGSASNTALKVGDTIKVGAYYEDDYGDDEEISKSEYDQLEYQWYVGDKQSSAPTASGYTPIEGATSRDFKLTAAQAGKYVACKVTYGSSKWECKFTGSTKLAIVEDEGATTPATPDAKTLAEAKQKLSTWKPSPVCGTDTNIVRYAFRQSSRAARLREREADSQVCDLRCDRSGPTGWHRCRWHHHVLFPVQCG